MEKKNTNNKKNRNNAKKKNNKNNKKIVIPLLIMLLIIGVVLVVLFIKKQGDNQKTLQQMPAEDEKGKYVTVLENGAKQNNSEKLSEDKKIDNLDFTQIQLVEKGRNNTINRNNNQ